MWRESAASLHRKGWPKGCKRGPPTDEHRRKLSEALKGRPSPFKGKRHSAETKRKISKAKRGRKLKPFTEEHRRRLGKVNKGRRRSEETKRKLSEALRGRCLSEEHRCKISEAGKGRIPWNKGKHLSKEHKHKLSEALRARWARGDYDGVYLGPPHVIYKGIRMRSTWEMRFATVLDALELHWEYEQRRFQYGLDGKLHTYTPDFYVPALDVYFDPHANRKDDDWRKFDAVHE